jgi:ABC-2 type transport system ATP-binding protein
MIEAQHLPRRYGRAVAVDDVSFVVRPGRVTGFLRTGGKSTTMRMILGLDRPNQAPSVSMAGRIGS